MHQVPFLLAARCFVILFGVLRLTTCDAQEVDFARDIRPLLSDRCFSCHGPDEAHREANLRFDALESLTEDRGGYYVLKPGDSVASELMKRILSDDEFEVMPPPEIGKPLNEAEKGLIRKWIDQGAKWAKHWAYEPPRTSPTPKLPTAQAERAKNWIDHYIASDLQKLGRKMSARAKDVTLLRRLSFDLTGLPPGEGADVSSISEANYADSVDQLLASPAFGERMAIYWLDLVRFADTVGYHGDQDHNITPYRDYVINAFNDNLPFDQFTIDQLAGDLLDSPSEEQIVATGYNRLLQTSHEGGVQPAEYLAIYQADRVRNVSAVWFGATIGCAQCHDHKYDPFTARDFYSLAAFFADVDEAQHFKVGSNSLPTKRPPEIDVLTRAQQLLQANLQAELQDAATSSQKPLKAALEQLEKSKHRTMVTQSIEPRLVRFLPRGDWLDDSGEAMQPSVPEFMGDLDLASRPTRLDLAHWLVDTQAKSSPGYLTARVFVNRLWMLFFGEGLSRSVEDFGGQGEAPTHPELLDRLAIEFVRSGWDVKHMVRLIVASQTYQQSSLETSWHRKHDPENRLLSRQHRFRLPAEMVRDVSLSCSNLMLRQIGGSSVKPYQPAGYYRHLNFPTRKYAASTDPGQWRRGLYVHWQRQFLHPMLRAFDAPTREECTAKRARSNTPLAALVWLNDPSFIEAAKHFAAEQLEQFSATEMDSKEARKAGIRKMFRRATSREPDAEEIASLLGLLEVSEVAFGADEKAAEELLSVGSLTRQSKHSKATWAAWTMLARAILNLNETYTRN
ncbi:MAG: PSD1 and planctomycete cytochrome C domain-containing protein [Planctomycetota bacterium]|nr:PSD1 and planctomycete cytochrome C domain-containing protein [Planctomycetota bacterium]